MDGRQPLRKVRADLEGLRDAMEDSASDHRYFLDTETGEVILFSEFYDAEEAARQIAKIDAAESGRYLEVSRTGSRDGYADMQDFIDSVEDKHVQELLHGAIQGRGAFRRFKNVLARQPAERQRWFEFQAARLDVRVREWLADEGCEPA
jgi:hypothetical protein